LDDGEVDLQFGMGVPEIGAGPATAGGRGLGTNGSGGAEPDAAPGSAWTGSLRALRVDERSQPKLMVGIAAAAQRAVGTENRPYCE
jgi:hypothetical protein